jgi:hypothetical protein
MSGKDTILEIVENAIGELKNAVAEQPQATQQGAQVSNDFEDNGWSAAAPINALKALDVAPELTKAPPALTSRKASTNVTPELQDPDVFDRGGNGRFVWVPKNVRDHIYIYLDVDNLFDPRLLRSNEALMSVMEQRLLKNTFSVPVYEFLPHLDEIEETLEDRGMGDLSTEDQARMNHLVKLLKEEKELLVKRFENVDSPDAEVTAEELVLFLNGTGRLFSVTKGSTQVAFKSKGAQVVKSMFGWYISIKGEVYVNFGDGIQQSQTDFEVAYFSGKKRIADTGIRMLSVEPELSAQLVERGRKYVQLTSKPSYMQYTGTILRKSWWSENHYKATGRIMIDMGSMRAMDTDYRHYFAWDSYGQRHGVNTPKLDLTREFTNEELITMSPFIYGFSFISKTWGEMIVDNVSEIQFRENAYEMLVLDEERKDMMFSLVESGMSGGDKDFIGGKGGGVIFMLAGTPGTGKTLSAEAIAEKLKRPLYMVGVGELGTDVASLETSLRNILDVATKWNAVLLLDECDIFMEARQDDDIERNAMVGIFLRLLEYYEGILFLTTNRADNIDEAFYSRISLAMYYEALDEATRAKVWANLFATYKVEGVNPEDLASHELNGRKIKQVIRIATALAHAKKRKVELADFKNVIAKEMQFRKAIAPIVKGHHDNH